MQLTHRAGLVPASLTLLGLAASVPVQAQTFYSSRTSFTAASTSLTTLTFDNLIGTAQYPQNYPHGTGYYNTNSTGITVGGINFVGVSNGYGDETSILGPDVAGGEYSLNGTTSLSGGRASLTVTLPSGTTSFGTDIGQANFGDPITIDALVTLANSQSFTQVLNFTAGSQAFLGFTDASPIASVVFSNPNDPSGSLVPYAIYDNVSFGPSAPVPEASTTVSFGLLLCLGLGGLVVSARRRHSTDAE